MYEYEINAYLLDGWAVTKYQDPGGILVNATLTKKDQQHIMVIDLSSNKFVNEVPKELQEIQSQVCEIVIEIFLHIINN